LAIPVFSMASRALIAWSATLGLSWRML